jgi:hypothetical protein
MVPRCPYSRSGGKYFPRVANWSRHMSVKHGINNIEYPAPEYMDGVFSKTSESKSHDKLCPKCGGNWHDNSDCVVLPADAMA